MSGILTAGDLQRIIWVEETTYGTTPVNGWKNGPQTLNLTPVNNQGKNELFWGGRRSFVSAAYTEQRRSTRFKMTSNEEMRADWTSPLLTGVLGTPQGTELLGYLPSFSMIVGVGKERVLYCGCKVNSLKITADSPKAILQTETELVCKYVEPIDTNGIVNGLQGLTLGAMPSATNYPAVQVMPPIMLDGKRINPIAWTFSVENNLVSEDGGETGADHEMHAVSVNVLEGARSIMFECELYLYDLSFLKDRLANKEIATLSFGLGNKRINLLNGRYVVDGGDENMFEQAQMKQKLRMIFESVVVE